MTERREWEFKPVDELTEHELLQEIVRHLMWMKKFLFWVLFGPLVAVAMIGVLMVVAFSIGQ